MCFSAPASFSAGIALTAIGILTLRKARKKQEYPLASIPLVFGIQQLAEGFLWLSLLKGNLGLPPFWFMQSYVAFAGIVWPLLAPFSVLMVEPSFRRRWMILPFLTIGLGVAEYTRKALFDGSLSASIVNDCIRYEQSVTQEAFLLPAYILSTCAAFFISSHRSINLIGIFNVLAFFITYYAYEINFASGWCFLAAIVSTLIYLHFSRSAKLPFFAVVLK